MEIIGKITRVFPETSGVSQAGKAWKKREYLIESLEGQYPQKFVFDFFGERADQYPLNEGQIVKLSFDINSREYNGRWYTNISAWRAEDASQLQSTQNQGVRTVQPPVDVTSQQSSVSGSNHINSPITSPLELTPNGPNDDLPF